MQSRTVSLWLLGAIAWLSACASPDGRLFDELDARSAAGPGGEVPASQTGEPGAAGDWSRPVEAGMPVPATGPPPIPRSAAPSPRVAGLDFLKGRWIAINPNKTVNEEIWSAPRGNALIGSFRQIRLDGDCAFIELSQIAVEGEELVLRLRHMHGRLEVPEGKSEVSLFKLVSLEKDRVEFTGSAGSESVTSVIYRRTSPTELEQSIGFAPESGQADFVTHYHLDREY